MNPSDFLNQFNEQALRPALAAAKEKLDQTLAALPISQLVEDAFAQMERTQPTVNLGVAIDPAKIEKAVDAIKVQLQKPAISLLAAHGIKQALNRTSTESLEAALLAAVPGNAGFEQQFMAEIVIRQLALMADDLRTAPVADVAAQIRAIARELPSDLLAAQLSQLLQAAPDMLPQQPAVKIELPPAQTVADLVQGLGKAASDALDSASKGATLKETVSALKLFPANANAIVARVLGQQPEAPKPETPAQAPPVAPKRTPRAPRKPRKGGKHSL